MKNQFKYRKLPIALALATSVGFVGLSYAQDEEPAAQSSGIVGEMLITARKVEESLQDVSLSISAYDADSISERSIEELEDVALYTPGLSFEDFSNGGFGTPTIRGASQISITQLEQNVSTFLDGVYIPRQYAVDVGALDLERIEVVKGPQSALYGANAFMGAINYVTGKPDLDEFTGHVGLVIGDDSRGDVSGSVSMPLMPGVLAVKVGGSISEYDGDWDNDYPGNPSVSPGNEGNLAGWDNSSVEVDIAIKPSDDWAIDLGYNKFDVFTETKAQARLTTGGGDTNCGGRLFGGFGPLTTFCGELPSTPVAPGTSDEVGFIIDPRTFGVQAETEFLTAGFSWDVNDNLALTYQFGNIDGEVFAAGNSDRDPLAGSTFSFFPGVFNAFTQRPIGEFEYDSHELRLEYNSDDGFYGMVGVFLSDGEDFDGGSAVLIPIDDPLEPITEPGFGFAASATTETEIEALFGRVSVPLTEMFVVSAEGRFTEETKTLTDPSVSTPIPTYDDDYFTGRLTLDVNLSEESLLYISAAQGVKSGGVNASSLTSVVDSERFYGADENTTYEIGSKNTLLDGRLQLNAAAYLVDWSNLQIQSLPTGATNPFTTPILTNIGSAESTGIELDAIFSVTDAVTLNASLALNDATYDSGTVSQRINSFRLCDTGNDAFSGGDPSLDICDESGELGGNSLPRTADTQWAVGAMYEGVLSDYDFFIRADYTGQSEQFVSELNVATIPSREILNLRAGLSGDAWSAEFWIKNALDEEYVSNAFYIPLSFQVEYVPSWGDKRRMGLTFNYNF